MSTSGAAPAGGPPSGAAGGDLAGVYPAPSVAKIQGTAVSAVAPTNGQLFQLVGGIWTPTTLVIPGPAASVTGPDAFGAASAVGVSTAYARQDHDHGLPANPAPAPSGVVTGPDAFGAAAAVGTSAAFSRGDHDHGLPANPSAPFAVPAIALGTAAAVGVSGSKIRADATIAAFDATAPVTQALGDAAAVGAAAVTARRDHRHGMPALASTVVGPDAYGAGAAVGTSVLPARADHDHGLPAAPAASLSHLSSFITADVSVAASTPTNITSLSLTAGTWLVCCQVSIMAAAVTADADLYLTATSAGAASGALGAMGSWIETASVDNPPLNFTTLVSPGSTTTYFLVAEVATAVTVRHLTRGFSAPNVSGMVAVKVA